MGDTEEFVIDEALEKLIDRLAAEFVRRYGPRSVDPQEVAQAAKFQLFCNPPKFDSAKGTREALIKTIVQRAALKHSARAKRHASRFKQWPEPKPSGKGLRLDPPEVQEPELPTLDGILEYIEDEPSRALCRQFVECDGNVSEVARRMKVSEGTIRYRIKVLGPRLLAAGYTPSLRRRIKPRGD